MSNRKPIVNLDVDGVLADFVGATLDIAHEKSSLRWRREDLKTWEIFDHIKDPLRPTLARDIREQIARKGFCSKIRPLPGAKDGVKRLREVAEVHIVTAPWKSSKTWCEERYEWLRGHFGFHHHEVTMASDKRRIHADILVDDKLENIALWEEYQNLQVRPLHPRALGLLWSTPHNVSDLTATRVASWDQVIDWVQKVSEHASF